MNKKSKTIIYIIYIFAVLFFLFGRFLFYPLQTNEEIEKKLIKEYEALGYTNVRISCISCSEARLKRQGNGYYITRPEQICDYVMECDELGEHPFLGGYKQRDRETVDLEKLERYRADLKLSEELTAMYSPKGAVAVRTLTPMKTSIWVFTDLETDLSMDEVISWLKGLPCYPEFQRTIEIQLSKVEAKEEMDKCLLNEREFYNHFISFRTNIDHRQGYRYGEIYRIIDRDGKDE